MEDIEILKNIDKKLLAILILLISARDISQDKKNKKQSQKVEVLLANAGLKAPEIAKILNKKSAAVQKTLQRSRKSQIR